MFSRMILFNEFVEHFLDDDKKKAKKYEKHKEGDEDNEYIIIEWKWADGDDDDCSWTCNMRWREPEGRWKKMKYNGSSPFAGWWVSFDDDE